MKDESFIICCSVTSGTFFFLGYIMFIGFFGAIMIQINTYNKEVLDEQCSAVKKELRRSGDQFTICSVLSFVTIFVAIISTLIPISLPRMSAESS